jgi:Holliday junction DNA helicase RuvA
VAAQDSARLTRVPGIGKKTAERLLLELRDKLEPGPAAPAGSPQSMRSDALNALVSLGYNEKEAAAALVKLAADLSTAEAIRQALKLLSKVL